MIRYYLSLCRKRSHLDHFLLKAPWREKHTHLHKPNKQESCDTLKYTYVFLFYLLVRSPSMSFSSCSLSFSSFSFNLCSCSLSFSSLRRRTLSGEGTTLR